MRLALVPVAIMLSTVLAPFVVGAAAIPFEGTTPTCRVLVRGSPLPEVQDPSLCAASYSGSLTVDACDGAICTVTASTTATGTGGNGQTKWLVVLLGHVRADGVVDNAILCESFTMRTLETRGDGAECARSMTFQTTIEGACILNPIRVAWVSETPTVGGTLVMVANDQPHYLRFCRP